MGQFHEASAMFRGVGYNQITTEDLQPLLIKKIASVKAKVEERRGRVARLMEEHGISEAALSDMLVQYMRDKAAKTRSISYGMADDDEDRVVIPAGAVQNIVTEKELIESEGGEVHRMSLILRNLTPLVWKSNPSTGHAHRDLAIHTLTDAELEYLGR